MKGKRGLTGPTGQLVAVVITRDDFHTKWTSPQVRTVTPNRAESATSSPSRARTSPPTPWYVSTGWPPTPRSTPTPSSRPRCPGSLRQVTLGSTDADKSVSPHYGIGGVHQARALTLSNLRIGRRGDLALRAASDLARFDLSGASGQSVAVGLAAANKRDVRRQRFDQVSLGDRPLSTFNVADWTDLGPDGLHQG